MRASPARIILSTAATEEQARSIARHLVNERLAACVNIVGPMRSIYRWHEAVEDESEFLLIVKTRASLGDRVERRILELHTYEVPEVLALKLCGGSSAYLGWLMESTTTEPSRARDRPARRRGGKGA